MTAIYSHDGEPVSPGDVLAPDEQAEYAAAQRNKPRSRTPRRPQHEWVDELGYDRLGRWHPEHDPEERR